MSLVQVERLSATGGALRAGLLTRFEELERLAADWERLWAADPNRHVFLSWPWARAWWRAYGATHRLCAAVVFDGSRVAGILPLVRKGGALHFLGRPDSDYTDILCEEDTAAEVVEAALRAILAASPGWRRCVLENLPENSRIVRSLGHLSPCLGGKILLTFRASCPAIVAGPPEQDPFRPRSRKESIRRHDRKLKGLGDVTFRHLESRPEIAQRLPDFVRQHVARRAIAGDASLLLSPSAVEFYRHLVDEFDPSSDLRFSVLSAGGTELAYHLGFECAGRFIWYKPSFDVDYWDWSPGEVIIGRLLDYASARGLNEFDFTIGEEAFKYRFANVVRRVHRLNVYPPGLRGLALRTFHRIREEAKRRALFRRLKTKAEALRTAIRSRVGLRGALEIAKRIPAAAWRILFARDEALLFRRKPGAELPQAAVAFERAKLSELARISIECPGHFGPEYLRNARESLRRGDACYIATSGGRPALIAWCSVRGEIAVPEFGSECTLKLPEPAALIRDCWTEPLLRDGVDFAGVVRAMAQSGSINGLDVWTWCGGRDRLAKAGIEAAGFRLAGRLRQVRLLGRFRWSRVSLR